VIEHEEISKFTSFVPQAYGSMKAECLGAPYKTCGVTESITPDFPSRDTDYTNQKLHVFSCEALHDLGCRKGNQACCIEQW
jgi:hypothetical protein